MQTSAVHGLEQTWWQAANKPDNVYVSDQILAVQNI